MVAYSFHKRFVEPILTGTKCQTIRTDRRRHARPGEELQLYTAMRTKHCRLITRATCEAVHRISILLPACTRSALIVVFDEPGRFIERWAGDRHLDAFAASDGFDDFADMAAFWREHHPDAPEFSGVLIRWEPIAFAEFQGFA